MIKKAYKVTIAFYYSYFDITYNPFGTKRKIRKCNTLQDIEFICYPDEFYICLEKNIDKEFSNCILEHYVSDAQKEIRNNWDYCILKQTYRNITMLEALNNYTLDEMEKFVEIFNFPIDKVIDI